MAGQATNATRDAMLLAKLVNNVRRIGSESNETVIKMTIALTAPLMNPFFGMMENANALRIPPATQQIRSATATSQLARQQQTGKRVLKPGREKSAALFAKKAHVKSLATKSPRALPTRCSGPCL